MHDDLEEHTHDDGTLLEEEEYGLYDFDTVRLTSVGIDVGTATSQVMLSRLVLKRMGAELSSRFVVVDRETLYLSPVHLTPYTADRERIDDEALGRLLAEAYREANISPDQVDAGAIILTGEAVRRDNARAIADRFAAEQGDFVCATAGHHFEAQLAAHGSGTIALTEGLPHRRLLNVDIGGGTTKLSVVQSGQIVETAALHIGGRLMTYAGGRIVLLEPGGAAIARNLGHEWKEGDAITPEEIEAMAGWMADAVMSAIGAAPLPAAVEQLFLTPTLQTAKDYEGVVFSGGVGEYVYDHEKQTYGDMGEPLGRALRARLAKAIDLPLLPARECIRATVMGASQYSVQVSGNTIYCPNPDAVLPQRNLQALRPALDLSGAIEPAAVTAAIRAHYTQFDLAEGESNVALVFEWKGDASFQRIDAFLQGLVDAIPNTLATARPVILVWDHDVGNVIGADLKEDRGVASEVLSIDGISLQDFDFIDIGRVLYPSGTVPVTIKSLVFHL